MKNTFQKKLWKLYDLIKSDRGRRAIEQFWEENQEYDDGHRINENTITLDRRTCLLIEFDIAFREFMEEVGITEEEYYTICAVLELVEKLYQICGAANEESGKSDGQDED